MYSSKIFGCIADDFTGASDAASFISQGGANTILLNGIPEKDDLLPPQIDAVVIALKTRTQETTSAVKDSMDAMEWLKSKGANRFYMKYCSTFDSTPKGNIGPICDSTLERSGERYTVLCPSLPINGRTVENGVLYVNGVPLSDTHMRNHPLTPMWDSRISVLMQEQSKYPCYPISRSVLNNKELLEETLTMLSAETKEKHFYVVPDYQNDDDAAAIYKAFGNLSLLTGGSGILSLVGKGYQRGACNKAEIASTKGRSLLFAGSCSEATKKQVQYYKKHLGNVIVVRPEEIESGKTTVEEIWAQANGSNRHVLVCGAGSAGEKLPADEGKHLAAILEDTLAEIAKLGVENGFQNIIAAGGETSGAITKRLGYSSYIIGKSVAPGVPIMQPVNDSTIKLVLKSGNFGSESFFETAIEHMEE